jgi:hypothetical protein
MRSLPHDRNTRRPRGRAHIGSRASGTNTPPRSRKGYEAELWRVMAARLRIVIEVMIAAVPVAATTTRTAVAASVHGWRTCTVTPYVSHAVSSASGMTLRARVITAPTRAGTTRPYEVGAAAWSSRRPCQRSSRTTEPPVHTAVPQSVMSAGAMMAWARRSGRSKADTTERNRTVCAGVVSCAIQKLGVRKARLSCIRKAATAALTGPSPGPP